MFKRNLWSEIIVFDPFGRIIVNVLPADEVILIIADDVVMEGGLPEPHSGFFIGESFQSTEYLGNRRARRLGAPLLTKCQQQMNVIWHKHVFIYVDSVVCIGNRANVFINDLANIR